MPQHWINRERRPMSYLCAHRYDMTEFDFVLSFTGMWSSHSTLFISLHITVLWIMIPWRLVPDVMIKMSPPSSGQKMKAVLSSEFLSTSCQLHVFITQRNIVWGTTVARSSFWKQQLSLNKMINEWNVGQFWAESKTVSVVYEYMLVLLWVCISFLWQFCYVNRNYVYVKYVGHNLKVTHHRRF
jgi:hypothetical protein